jgi:poly-gamma-glutamate synthesis protein (capsule biosynthesis protein)
VRARRPVLAVAALAAAVCGAAKSSEAAAANKPTSPSPTAASRPGCVTFVGDVMLSRGVAREIERRKKSPWVELRASHELAPAWVGNFEGSVLPTRNDACARRDGLCLGVDPQTLEWLKGTPFRALSIANNHIDDFGPGGHATTQTALRRIGIEVIDAETGPTLMDQGGSEWALVALNLAGGTAAERQAALERARLEISLARAHTNLVAVLPHWGREGKAFAAPEQELWARVFTRWGATLIVGTHAHVIQPGRCAPEVATYFGLGNHVFDEAGAPNREGLAVTCCPDEGGLECAPIRTERSATSVYPMIADDDREAFPATPPCSIRADAPDRRWLAHPARNTLRLVQPFFSAGPGTFFSLRRHWSSFDHENALRPYVFRVEDRSGAVRIVDVWRGTALARPLVAARLFEWRGAELLCAIHRADTFLDPNPRTMRRVRLVYRWTGFGFSGVHDDEAQQACDEL